MQITLHKKHDTYGWQAITTLPSDSPLWDKADVEWIDTLFKCCTDVLTVGDTMYQLTY
jgi:hypothetical protein